VIIFARLAPGRHFGLAAIKFAATPTTLLHGLFFRLEWLRHPQISRESTMNLRWAACLPFLLLGFSLRAADKPEPNENPLAAKIRELTRAPHYRHAHWGLLFIDLNSGEVLYQENADKLFAPASVTKCFTVATALDALGADYRFRTPVYRRGEVTDSGELKGDLILVASGDLTMGGRTTEKGEIAFTNSDHTYATFSEDAALTPQDPLAGLNEIARQIAAAGIKKVSGNLLVDDRLFEHAEGSGSGPGNLTPIIVNDNVIDFLIEPTEAGKPAKITVRPQTGLYDIQFDMQTVETGTKAETWIRVENNKLTLSGKIPAGRAPLVRIYEVPDPAGWARSLLMEALQRANVEVAGGIAIRHPEVKLPAKDEIEKLVRVAQLESPPFSENARLVLKVSHNLHASTLPLLVAAHHGKRRLVDGMTLERAFLQKSGVEADAISFGGGAGGSRADYVTPKATVELLVAMTSRQDFPLYERAMPSLGVDGTLAKSVSQESPARDKVRAKTGTLLWDDLLQGNSLLTSKALAGYMTTKNGRKLAFAAFVNGVHLRDGIDTKKIGSDLGKLAEIVYLDE
jgi:serine-type D-Ala-D-Ala carboxypeptidase/endopeptidase (penicillin-binding protein 4)